MKKILFLSIALFIVVGFLFPSSPLEPVIEYNSKNSLKKIDFTSTNIKNYVTQGYGYTQFAAVFGGLRGNRHNGIDIAASYGAEIHSESDGEIIYIGDQDKYCPKRAYGKFVVVKNKNDDHALLYAHLSKIKVALNDNLKEGDLIGLVGVTGLATGPHLHFSIFKASSLKMINDKSCGPKPQGSDTNPLKYLES